MNESAELSTRGRGHGEYVVLLDDDLQPIGTHEKGAVHTDSTPLHAAFSCYLFNSNGEVLVTRRALAKQTWPGVWTNSFCGHPAPGERPEDAVARRASYELGVTVRNVTVVLADFRYRAVDASGIVENEFCPVFTAEIASDLAPNPDEVSEWAWAPAETLADVVSVAPYAFSPWMAMQLPLLGLASLEAARSQAPTLQTEGGAP